MVVELGQNYIFIVHSFGPTQQGLTIGYLRTCRHVPLCSLQYSTVVRLIEVKNVFIFYRVTHWSEKILRPKLTYYQINLAKCHDQDVFLTASYFTMDTLGGEPVAGYSVLCALVYKEIILNVFCICIFNKHCSLPIYLCISDPVNVM